MSCWPQAMIMYGMVVGEEESCWSDFSKFVQRQTGKELDALLAEVGMEDTPWGDWERGTTGLVIGYVVQGGFSTATALPEGLFHIDVSTMGIGLTPSYAPGMLERETIEKLVKDFNPSGFKDWDYYIVPRNI